MTKPMHRGFTLVELVIYMGLMTLILGAMVAMFLLIEQARNKEQVIAEVEQQGILTLEQITQTIRNAEFIATPATSTSGTMLSIKTSLASTTPTVFDMVDGVLRVTEGSVGPVALTSTRVVVSDLLFSNLSRANTPGTLRIQFTLRYGGSSNKAAYTYEKIFYGNASIRDIR